MKCFKYLIIIFFLTFLLQPLKSNAQEEDFMIWSGFSLTKNFQHGLSARLRQEIRLRENATQVQKGFTDIGVRYRYNKYIRFAVHYRYNLNVRKDFFFSSRHRLNADMILRYKYRPVVLNYRLRYQMHYRDIMTTENGLVPRQFIRHKLQAHLNLNRKWSPYAATEFFHTVTDFPGAAFVQNRYRIGVAYEINRHNNITLYYMLRTKQNVDIPVTDYILGFRLNVFLF